MIKLKCKNPKCRREWEYKGDKKFYASCPDCKTSVKIPPELIEEQDKKNENDSKNSF
jgi:hypothetical protein